MLWVGISIRVRCTTFCDKLCQWLATGRWFSPGASVSSINKPDHLDITEILLKVALNTIKQTNKQTQTKNPNDGEHESIRRRWLHTEIELFLFQCSSYHFFFVATGQVQELIIRNQTQRRKMLSNRHSPYLNMSRKGQTTTNGRKLELHLLDYGRNFLHLSH
jgi:hypothetical protein